jgi:hypothetical protein
MSLSVPGFANAYSKRLHRQHSILSTFEQVRMAYTTRIARTAHAAFDAIFRVAAFALRIGAGSSVVDAARFANAAAALKCTRFGGRLGAPNRAEVEALLAKGS